MGGSEAFRCALLTFLVKEQRNLIGLARAHSKCMGQEMDGSANLITGG